MKIVQNCIDAEGRPGFCAMGMECHPYTPGDPQTTLDALQAAARDANLSNATELGNPDLARGSVAG